MSKQCGEFYSEIFHILYNKCKKFGLLLLVDVLIERYHLRHLVYLVLMQ